MIISMTGFGKAEGNFGTRRYRIEVTSVNNRFLEISMRYPKRLASKEYELKEVLRKKISRGKLNVFIGIDTDSRNDQGGMHDENRIREFLNLAQKINKIIGSKEDIKLRDILELGEYVSLTDESNANEKETEFVGRLIGKAADDLSRMKTMEGKNLEKDMLGRIKSIEKEADKIVALSKKRVKIESERIKKKVDSIISGRKDVDDKRVEMEIVLFADKSEISEELTRLRSHTKFFTDYAKSDELAGRRLNFLIQEMNREINTIASKSSDAVISQKSAFLKEELEKIREQLQNVE
jgi:uncharacterized protein (TIGR00255 family)